MDCAIYVVFSSTPTGMGRMIRLVTRHNFNHVSLSLTQDIQKLYSFARYYRTIPLYGGFVEESILRYQSFAGDAKVKICRIPADEAAISRLRQELDQLWNERDTYIYNHPDAMVSLLHRRAKLPKAYTCVSFVWDILSRYHFISLPQVTPSICQLEEYLKEYVIYEGSARPMVRKGRWGTDPFPQYTSRRYAVYTTARHFGRLAKRVLKEVAG